MDADLHFGTPLFTDVRSFITHPDDVRHKIIVFGSDGNIGMGLREKPHDLGEIVSDIIPGSQAAEAGVQIGWVITEVDGKPFRKSESVLDVGEDFKLAKQQAPTVSVKFDVRSSVDCTKGNCSRSDKFPVASSDACAQACSELSACESWSFGLEGEDAMCWIRSDRPTLRAQPGSVAGSRVCVPPAGGHKTIYVIGFAMIVLLGLMRSGRIELPGNVTSWLPPSARSGLAMGTKKTIELTGRDCDDESLGLMDLNRRKASSSSSWWGKLSTVGGGDHSSTAVQYRQGSMTPPDFDEL
jgi:hypothetical protein